MTHAPAQSSATPRDRFPLYPFLFAIYPILNLYAGNRHLVVPTDLLFPLTASFVFVLVFMVAARLVMKSWLKAGILTAVVFFLFFSYGQAVDAAVRALNGTLRPGLIMLPVWMITIVAAAILLLVTRRRLAGLAVYLRILAVILTVVPLVQIVAFATRTEHESRTAWDDYVTKSVSGARALEPQGSEARPDIYYIILDAYSSADFLKQSEGFDNSEFIDFLKSKGFYVADQARSNYLWTSYSMPSSLNMNYLDTLAKEAKIGVPLLRRRLEMFGRPLAVQLLKNAGYTIVSLPCTYAHYCLADPDVKPIKGSLASGEFNAVVIESTLLRVLDPRRYGALPTDLLNSIDALADVPHIKQPTFTLAHFTVAHHPFYFNTDGSLRDNILSEAQTAVLPYDEFSALYIESIQLLNHRMERVISEILDRSQTPPIIIIQGDHGRWRPDYPAPGIISAYYLPGEARKLLYPSISPVNNFRLVFDYYFGTDFGLLEDVTYWSEEKDSEVTFRVLDE